MVRLKSFNNAFTTLNENITNVQSSFDVVDASLFVDVPFRITINQEIMEVTNVVMNTFTVLRGQEGTTAVSHSISDRVENRWTAGTHQDLEIDFVNRDGDTMNGILDMNDNEIRKVARVIFEDRFLDNEMWTLSESASTGNLLLTIFDNNFQFLQQILTFDKLNERLLLRFNTFDEEVWHDGNTTDRVGVNELDLVEVDSRYVNRTGDDLSGNMTFNNNVGIFGRDTGGNLRAVMLLNNFNNVQFGNFVNPSLITGPNNNSLQFMTTDFQTKIVWHSGPSTKTSPTDVEITDPTRGVILTAPNASRWRITVNNAGNLITTAL